MTPEIFASIRPYLRTLGSATINVNTAPAAVLWAIPGMNDAIVTRILAVRSQQQRITSLQGLGIPPAVQQRIGPATTFAISQLELTVTAVPAPPAHVVQETWTIDRSGDQARVRWTDLAY
jgi:hypothetical protein